MKISLLRQLGLLLLPGIGIKRWLAMGVFGILIAAVGVAFGVSVSLSAVSESVGETTLAIGRVLTLNSVLSGLWRGVLFGGIGIIVFTFATVRLFRVIQSSAEYGQGNNGVIENLSNRRARRMGPRVVAIGGGTGLSTLLRGVKAWTDDVTAIVTVSDDGGSSGRLRSELGISPPGDARQCLIALSDSEPLMENLLSYRFQSGSDLHGHNVGNLILAALSETQGGLHQALQATARLLAVKGRVMPSSEFSNLILKAETESGNLLVGESVIGSGIEPIGRIWLDPSDCPANPAAVAAIEQADVLVIGPGSLFTSILPNFLIKGIADAVAQSQAPKIFVCNVATEHGETDGLSGPDHLVKFRYFSGIEVSHFLCNSRPVNIAPEHNQDPVLPVQPESFTGETLMVDLVSSELPSRHDPNKLASAVLSIVRHGKNPNWPFSHR